MRRWTETAERVASTTKTSEKTAILGEYLAGLSPDELPIAAVFLTGRPFPEADQRSIGVGWAGLGGAVLRVAGADPDAMRRAYDRSSDVATAVGEVLEQAGHAPDPAAEPTLPEVSAAFEAIEAASGAAAKAAILEALIARSSPLTVTGIVKVLSGELRIGLREGLLEAAIAKAFDRPLDEVKRAGMLTGDVGRTATLAREGRLGDAALGLFHPLKFMLASPAEDAAEIIGRLGPTVWVEDKYDGIRAQLHRAGDEVRLYSRDLHDISGQFPEVVASATGLPWAGILEPLDRVDGGEVAQGEAATLLASGRSSVSRRPAVRSAARPAATPRPCRGPVETEHVPRDKDDRDVRQDLPPTGSCGPAAPGAGGTAARRRPSRPAARRPGSPPGQVARALDDLRELAADVVQVAASRGGPRRRSGGAGRGCRRTCPPPRRSGPSRARISAASSAGEASMNLSGLNSASAALRAGPPGRGPRSGRCRR